MKILALDTATEACSAALYIDGEKLHQYQVAPREHSRLILQMLDDLLKQADLPVGNLDAIAFGRGPGSFMGVRIAAGVAQGIAFASDLPVLAISTLQTIAEVARQQAGCEQVLAAIDARMEEVYWGAYRYQSKSGWQLDGGETVARAEQVSLPESGKWLGAGTGWGVWEETFRQEALKQDSGLQIKTVLPDCLPSAEAMLAIAVTDFQNGKYLTPEQAQPVYLRNDVAKKPKIKTFAQHLNLE